MKVLGYTLVKHGDDSKLDESEQRKAIEDYCATAGLTLVGVAQDGPVGVLPSSPDKKMCTKHGVNLLLEEAPPKWRAVVVVAMDRLQHPSVDIATELVKLGRRIVLVGEEIDLAAEVEEEEKPKSNLSVAERLLRGREAGARAGKHQSGPAPYGYVRDYSERSTRGVTLSIEPEESEVVQLIFTEYLRRKSMKRLIEYLASKGLKTRRHKEWSRAGVSWILKNETYLGKVHFGKIRARGQHDPIITPIIFNKVQKLIKKNNKRGGRAAQVSVEQRARSARRAESRDAAKRPTE